MIIRGMHQTFRAEEDDGEGAGADDIDSTDSTEPTDTPTGPSVEEFATLQAENARLQEAQRILDDFQANPEATLRGAAERLNMQLVPKQSGGDATSTSQVNTEPPQALVDSISQNLPPEMQFMSTALAKATHAANQAAQRPFQEQQQQLDEQRRAAERTEIAAEMDASHPNWKDSLSDMEERFAFIKQAVNGGAMRHPKFGSLQQMLHGLATGGNTAATTAAKRMRDAALNATSTSDDQAPNSVDVTKQIAEAKTRDSKWDIAFKAAMAEKGNL